MSSPSWRVDLPVAGRPVLVAGGAGTALGPVSALLQAGARVTVTDAAPDAALVDLAARDLLDLHRRPTRAEDVLSAWLVVAVTGDAIEDSRVDALADTHGRICLRPGTVPPGTGDAGGPGHRSPAEEANGGGPGAGGGSTGDGRAGGDSAGDDRARDESAGHEPAGTDDRGTAGGEVGRPVVAGQVVLVGGGPGDPGLITVAGAAALSEADVVITDRLAPLALLDGLAPGVLVVDVSKVPGGGPTTSQDEINRLLIDHARAGRRVVRLKGGDPFVFGRGAEEWQACAEQGIAVRVIPGVTSAVAVPALAGIPVTHRDANQGFTVLSAHVAPEDPRSRLDYAALARSGTALVVLMGVGTLAAVTAALVAAGMDPATPAATIADGGLPGQRVVRGTAATIADLTAGAGIRPPAITVIGTVAGFTPVA